MKITFDSIFSDSNNYGVVFFHLVLVTLFALLRIPLLRNVTKHFESGTNRKIEEYVTTPTKQILFTAFYQSAMTQLAWGVLDLVPISTEAKALNLVQVLISFLVTAGTVNLVLKKR